MGVIAEQIKFLQEQAMRVMQEAKVNADLNHAAGCVRRRHSGLGGG